MNCLNFSFGQYHLLFFVVTTVYLVLIFAVVDGN